MPLRVTFDLEDKDLKYFRNMMRKAQASAQRAPESEVIAQAETMIEEVKAAGVPNFVAQRIDKLSTLIDMLRDAEWSLPAEERNNVLTALAYFTDPEDLIPDNVPVLGYIDDAIMIELVVKELKPEIDAFVDFCRYRTEEALRNRNPNVTYEQYLDRKRRELHQRMRRRRRRTRNRTGAGGGRTRLRLF